MSGEDDIRDAIEGLRCLDSRPLLGWSLPSQGRAFRPRAVLAPWAESAAGALHARFGNRIDLVVGVQRYPERTLAGTLRLGVEGLDVLDPGLATVSLPEPLSVSSGHSVWGEIVVDNRSRQPLVIRTNGQITARVVDVETGAIVGIDAGGQKLPLITFTAAAKAEVAVPLLVGTASIVPDLGYAVPAGTWGLRRSLCVPNHHTERTSAAAGSR